MHPGVTEHEQAATFSVAKADGEAPVAAYLAAMPGRKSPASRRSSAVRSQPAQGGQVELPFDGIEGQDWFLAFHGSTKSGDAAVTGRG